nr:leucine-rich repeat serine/threonine-protein kinase 2-like [Vulpes vulpes]
MASGSCQGCEEEDEETLKKLIVRLNNVQEGKQIETLVQILEDMLVFTYADHASKLFQGKKVHVPVLIVLDLYMRVASVQQVKELFSCHPFPFLSGNRCFSVNITHPKVLG